VDLKIADHPSDRLNLVRGLAAPAILLTPYFLPIARDHLFISAIVIFILIGETNYILHLHIHRPFSRRPFVNLLLDAAMGISTAMAASNWRIQHKFGHHAGHDEPYCEWRDGEREAYTPRGAIVFCLRSIWPTFWLPLRESFEKGVLQDIKAPLDYRYAFLEQALLVAAVVMLFVVDPIVTVLFLLPWYVLTYLITRYVDYINHYGCAEDAIVFESSNNTVNRLFNLTCHNFGFHTAHHFKPAAHWTELPAIHESIKDRIPQRLIKQFSWSCLIVPYHFLRATRGQM